MAKAYWTSVYEAGGGKFIARGVAAYAYEAGLKQRTVLVEFESLEKAVACHDSPAYQEALQALEGGVTRDLRIVEGV